MASNSARGFAARASCAALFLLATAIHGCGDSATTCGGRPCTNGDAGTPEGIDSGPSRGGDSGSGPTDRIMSLEVSPADPVLEAGIGDRPTVAFHVVGVRGDGSRTTALEGRWSLDVSNLGAMGSGDGAFEAYAEGGGRGTVQVEVVAEGSTLSASTSITVRRGGAFVATGTPSDAETHFTGTPATDAAAEPDVVYPLEGALMPQSVYPANVQWTRGAASDLFRVRLRKTNIDILGYTSSSDLAWLVDETAWRTLARTDPDEPVALTVERYVGAESRVVISPTRSFRFANGSTFGTVYYWDALQQKLLRIPEGTGEATEFMDAGVCVGCHAVSPNGRYLAGRLSNADNTGAIYDLTDDLRRTRPSPTVYPVTSSSPHWYNATWSKDSDLLLVDTVSMGLKLMDPFRGVELTPSSGTLPTSNAAQPAWAPDGHAVAFVSDVTESYRPGFEQFGNGNLSLIPVSGRDGFGTPSRLLRAADVADRLPTWDTISHPTWTPDSRWLAFQLGEQSTSTVPMGIYLVGETPGSTPVRLAAASRGVMSTENSYAKFSPYTSGGYFWLAFISRTPYGNAHVGNRGRMCAADHICEQIWITAIDQRPDGTLDPSHVPYWLPGQRVSSDNISLDWAAVACRADGNECAEDAQCCTGRCIDHMCTSDTRCRMRGETCGGSGCCGELLCIANVCGEPPI